jgi:hypothetical protein
MRTGPSFDDLSSFGNKNREGCPYKPVRVRNLPAIIESDRKAETIRLNKLLNLGFPISDKDTDELNTFILKDAIHFFYSRSLLPALGSIRSHKFQDCDFSLDI